MPSKSRRRRSSNRSYDDESDDESYTREKSKRRSSSRRKQSYSDDDDSDYSSRSGDDESSASSTHSSVRYRHDDASSGSGSESESRSESNASSSRKSMSSESDVDTASEASNSDDDERYATQKATSSAATTTGRSISKQKVKNSGNASRLSMAASLALQRRKKESPQLKLALDNRRVREVDYHKNVTGLYTHIENQRWREVAERCRTHVIETKTWVYRMDKGKKNILWRMLPIHTAVLYRAPVYVLLDLIQAYPDGANSPDDRRMLPIHMACRVVCKEDVLRLLLKNAPGTVFAEDIKGRTPRDFLAESKRENKSKVLQKVNERNRKNLLKILKEYEQMEDAEQSDNKLLRKSKSAVSRSSRKSGDSGTKFAEEYSLAGKKIRSRSSSTRRGLPPANRGGSSRRQYEEHYDDDDASRMSHRSRVSRVSRSPRASGNGRSRHSDDYSVSSRRSRSSRVSRVPKPSRSHRYDDDDDDNYSRSSRYSRVSRVKRSSRPSRQNVDDDDDASRASRRSRSSRVSRSSRNNPKRSAAKNRLPKMPKSARHVEKDYHDEVHADEDFTEDEVGVPLDIKTVSIDQPTDDRPVTADSGITNASGVTPTSAPNDAKKEEKEEKDEEEEDQENVEPEDFEGPLGELWLELEENYPIPEEEFDEALKGENARKAQKKKIANKEAVAKIKYYEPPKELKKLLVVINSSEADASFDMKKRPATAASTKSKSSRAPLMPGRDNAASRRVNACGALKALSKNEKNRLRLGRTKGVVSSLCNALRDPSATNEERFRCSNTLMFLSVPKKNWEAIFNADKELLPTLTMTLQDEDPRVRYNASFCVFLLAKSEANRYDILSDVGLITALVEVSDIEIGTDNDNDNDEKSLASSASVDGDLAQKFHNLGSPSGIRQQGSPTSDDESKRGCRLCALKAFLSFSKLQEGANTMVHRNELLTLLMKISGTMTAEENLLCMAIIANLTRDRENIKVLIDQSGLTAAIEKGLRSRNVEIRKCAAMALQNLSCNKLFRSKFSTFDNADQIVAMLGMMGTDVDDGTGKDSSKPKSAERVASSVEGQVNAIHTMRNLSIEPSNIIPLTNVPGVTASLLTFTMYEEGMEEKENLDSEIRYVASDALSNMSQWLNGVAVACAEKNNVDLQGRSLNSLKVSTWNQWE